MFTNFSLQNFGIVPYYRNLIKELQFRLILNIRRLVVPVQELQGAVENN